MGAADVFSFGDFRALTSFGDMKKQFLFLLLGLTSAVCAQNPGELDPSFGNNGKVITVINYPAISYGMNVAPLPGGKTLVAGVHDNLDYFALVRYMPDGSLDNSFAGQGIMASNVVGWLKDMELLSDGKILLAGQLQGGNSFRVAKRLSDGQADFSFATPDGAMAFSVGTSNAILGDMLALPDGKILLGGYARFGPVLNHFVLARLNADGTFDASFGTGGIINHNMGLAARLEALLRLPDGKIVAAGSTANDEQEMLLIRYLSSGIIDSSFGTDGVATTGIFDLEDGMAYDLVAQPGGKLLLAGQSAGQNGQRVATLARFTSEGQPDVTFVGGGLWKFEASGRKSLATSLALQADGKILVGIEAEQPDGYTKFCILRHLADGGLDAGFGTAGVATVSLSGGDDYLSDIAVRDDGKILATGTADWNGNNGNDIGVVRLLPDPDMGLVDFAVEDASLLFYPNPVREQITLEYTLAKPQTVCIELWDMQGKLLHTFLPSTFQPAGKQVQVLYFPGGLASGNYLMLLSSPEGKRTVKVMY